MRHPEEALKWLTGIFLVALLIGMTTCETPSNKTVVEELSEAAQTRDVLSAALTAPYPSASQASRYADIRWNSVPHTNRKGPCGSGTRPYVWWRGAPRIGGFLIVDYDPFGVPMMRGYDLNLAWVLLAIGPAPLEPVVRLGGGCPLWIDPRSKQTLVWEFHGKEGYKDTWFAREAGGREIRLTLFLEELEDFIGQEIHTQLVTWNGKELKTSQLVEARLGL